MHSDKVSQSPPLFVPAVRALTIALGLLAAGCDEAPEAQRTVLTEPEENPAPELPRIKWLDAHGPITPERWLASRAANADVDEDDPSVAAIRESLKAAANRFGEPPRMIANRVVQLEEMLAAQGITESAPELVQTLTATGSDVVLKEGFGSLCQHYFILRQQGVSRDAAVEQLKEAHAEGMSTETATRERINAPGGSCAEATKAARAPERIET